MQWIVLFSEAATRKRCLGNILLQKEILFSLNKVFWSGKSAWFLLITDDKTTCRDWCLRAKFIFDQKLFQSCINNTYSLEYNFNENNTKITLPTTILWKSKHYLGFVIFLCSFVNGSAIQRNYHLLHYIFVAQFAILVLELGI